MKRFKFLSVVIAGILMIAAVGCTTYSETQDGYGSRRATGNRVYVDDPYRGTIVLEKDPWTGRYYEVDQYGSYGSRYYRGYPYGTTRVYGRSSGGRGGYYRGGTVQRQPSPQQQRQNAENKSEARKKVLGN